MDVNLTVRTANQSYLMHVDWRADNSLVNGTQLVWTDSCFECLLQNMPNVRDHDASVYLRLQGDALSVGGYENNPVFWDEVSLNIIWVAVIM